MMRARRSGQLGELALEVGCDLARAGEPVLGGGDRRAQLVEIALLALDLAGRGAQRRLHPLALGLPAGCFLLEPAALGGLLGALPGLLGGAPALRRGVGVLVVLDVLGLALARIG